MELDTIFNTMLEAQSKPKSKYFEDSVWPTHPKVDWLTRKVHEIIPEMSYDQIFVIVDKLRAEDNVKRYKYLTNLVYSKDKKMLEMEINA